MPWESARKPLPSLPERRSGLSLPEVPPGVGPVAAQLWGPVPSVGAHLWGQRGGCWCSLGGSQRGHLSSAPHACWPRVDSRVDSRFLCFCLSGQPGGSRVPGSPPYKEPPGRGRPPLGACADCPLIKAGDGLICICRKEPLSRETAREAPLCADRPHPRGTHRAGPRGHPAWPGRLPGEPGPPLRCDKNTIATNSEARRKTLNSILA